MSKFRGAGKWRNEGPVRTNTGSSIRGRIGPPIPIPDDDEFPIRSPGTGIATPLGNEALERQFRLRASTASEHDHALQQTDDAVVAPLEPAGQAPSPPTQTTQVSQEAGVRRTNQPSALRNSQTSVPSGSSAGKPQRKKSSLRSVFGRLFGKKRKDSNSSSTREQGAGGMRAGQHRSDPTALNRSPKDTTSSQKRSASLPINEYNRALRSHSTATEDFPPHDTSNEPARESIQADGYTRPRRATTSSRLWTPNKTPGYVDWTGLSPRPASSHARGSKVVDDAEADMSIGMAVTSGSHPNRRSRSLGEIRETVVAHPIARRRSDEIKYWRESYEPGVLSPMSSNKAEAEEPVLLDQLEISQEEEPQEPPQPFNFGPLGELAGMKITQAANLETRVQRLEERMSKMERMMSQRQYLTSGDHVQLQDPPNRESRNERSSSATRPSTDNSEPSLPKHRSREPHRQYLQDPAPHSQQRSSSYGSSRPSTISTHNSYHPSFESFHPPTVPVPDAALSSGQNTARPLSTSTTIRGIPSSSPTMAKDAPLTGEHYVVLTNMILAEQAARQQLEAVVRTLQQQLQSLQSANSTSYPTPGSDHPGDPLSEGTVVGGEFSSFEQDDSSDDEGRYLHGEVYQTPNEDRGHFGDEIFGAVTSHYEGMKGEPRTLSLSQITLGKGMEHSLNF